VPKRSSSKDSLRERIDSILASKQLTLSQVSLRSESLFGRTSEYFIPHNLYYELTRGSFTPSIYHFAELSRIPGYRRPQFQSLRWKIVSGLAERQIPSILFSRTE